MFYILIEFTNQGNPSILAYQEVYDGMVQRYTTLEGVTIDPLPPGGSRVIDANPPQPSWALPDPPPAPPPPPGIRYVTKPILLDRFTDAELRALTISAKSNAANQAYVSVFFERFRAEGDIKLGEETTFSLSLQSLETGGALAAGRAAEILNVPVELTTDTPQSVAALAQAVAKD